MTAGETMQAACLAGLAFVLFLVMHVLVWRLPRIRPQGFVVMLGLGVIAYTGSCVAANCIRRAHCGTVVVSGSMFAFFMMLYLHFYAGILRSVSVRILEELSGSSTGRMTTAELDMVYPRRRVVEDRVRSLVESGHVLEEDATFRVSGKGVRLVRVGLALARVFALETTG